MKAYEYNKIYKEVIRELLEEGKIELSELLFRYESVDEFCDCVGWNEDFDVKELIDESDK